MLPNSFEPLADEHPELRTAFGRISQWINLHQDWNILDPRILAKDLRDLDAGQLATALSILAASNLFRRVFMVTTPSGVLAEGQYEHLRQVPERVADRFHQYFDTAESDIVPVLTPR